MTGFYKDILNLVRNWMASQGIDYSENHYKGDYESHEFLLYKLAIEGVQSDYLSMQMDIDAFTESQTYITQVTSIPLDFDDEDLPHIYKMVNDLNASSSEGKWWYGEENMMLNYLRDTFIFAGVNEKEAVKIFLDLSFPRDLANLVEIAKSQNYRDYQEILWPHTPVIDIPETDQPF